MADHDRPPVVLMHKDYVAEILEPLVTSMLDHLVERHGVERVQSHLPIKANTHIVLASGGGKPLACSTAVSEVTALDLKH